ncbi:SIR2 family protein [Geobacter anodireducens]
MSKVCMLLGAGASIEYGVPSTPQLTEQLEVKILNDCWVLHNKADETYKLIRNTLKSFLINPGGEHFEQIYHVIDELSQASYVVQTSAFDEFRYLIQPFIEIKNNGILDSAKLTALGQRYLYYVYEIISKACDTPAFSVAPFSNFLNNMTSAHTLRIYSLNYDDYVLQAKPDLYNGFEKRDNGKFNKKEYFSNSSISSVFQLHGSIRLGYPSLRHHNNFEIGELAWFENREEALKHCEANSSGDRQMDGGEVKLSAVVTGLNKLARLQSFPFNYYYSSLGHDLMESEYVIVAGYGMGDIHVNKWLKEARLANPGLKVIIVDKFAPTFLSSIDRKLIELIHMIRIDFFGNPGNLRRGPGTDWILVPSSKAAVWAGGFQAFLNDPNLDIVLKSI